MSQTVFTLTYDSDLYVAKNITHCGFSATVD